MKLMQRFFTQTGAKKNCPNH